MRALIKGFRYAKVNKEQTIDILLKRQSNTARSLRARL